MFKTRVYIILLLCLTFDVYFNVIEGKFVIDDNYFIKDNPGVHTLSDFGGFFTDTSRTASQELRFDVYRPLTTISLALTYRAFGLDPLPYHLISVILHALNTILVFYLSRRILNPPSPRPSPTRGEGDSIPSPSRGEGKGEGGLMAFFIAAIFAVHPVQTEAVSWISGRGNVQFLFFMLTSFLIYLKFGEKKKWFYYILSLLFYAFSILSKETGLVLPALVLVFFVFAPGEHKWREFKKQLIRMIPFFAAGALYLGVRTYIGIQMSFGMPYGDTILSRIPIVIWTAVTYLKISLFPIYLSIQYWVPKPSVLFGPWSGVALSSIIAVVYFSWRLRKVSYLYPLGLAWFVVGLSPFLNIIPSRMIASERFLYLPIIGFAIFLVQGVFDISGKRAIRLAVIFLLVIIGLYSVRTIIRNNDWVEPIRFWTKELNNNPGRALAPYTLGVLYDREGKKDKAEEYYLLAMKEYSGYSMFARNNLALIFEDRKEPEKAIVLYEDGIRLYPDNVPALVNLGLIYIDGKDYKKAEEFLLKALKVNPDSYYVHNALRILYEKVGLFEKASEHRQKAMQLSPNFGVSRF